MRAASGSCRLASGSAVQVPAESQFLQLQQRKISPFPGLCLAQVPTPPRLVQRPCDPQHCSSTKLSALKEVDRKREDDAKSYLEAGSWTSLANHAAEKFLSHVAYLCPVQKHGLTSFMQFLIQSLMKAN